MVPVLRRDFLVFAISLMLLSLSVQYLSGRMPVSSERSLDSLQIEKSSRTPGVSPERGIPTPESLGSILNFSVGDQIYFGGQPSADDLVLLQKKGVVTVVNLRGQDEMNALDFDEKEAVTRLGMEYIHLPLTKGITLSDEQINRILDVVRGTEKAPAILHCASSNRVGYIWAMYRALRGDVETNEAIRQGEAAGLRSDSLRRKARDFISRNRR